MVLFFKKEHLFALATAFFLALYWLASHNVHIHAGGDTTAFEAAARTELGWNNIFGTDKPPIYPALFLLTGFRHSLVVDIQCAAYMAAWIGLAAVFWRAAPGWRGAAAALCVYDVALFPHFAAWNHVLMSESLSISMSVGAFACLIAFITGARWPAFAGFVVLMCVKCWLRDFDAFLCVFFIPVLPLLAWYRRIPWQAAAATALLFVGMFLFVSLTADQASPPRWFFAMMDNVGKRILPDPAWLASFKAQGMPVSDLLLTMKGRFAHEEHWRFFNDPRLADFRAWILAHGRGAYTAYLLHHPRLILQSLWDSRQAVFQYEDFPEAYYFDPGWRFDLPPGNGMAPVYGLGTLGFLALAAAQAARRVPPRLRLLTLTSLLLWLMPLPIAFAIYHADAMEILRHALPVLLQSALALLTMLLTLLIWSASSPKPRRKSATAE